MIASLPVPVTATNLDFVLAKTRDIVLLRFPDGEADDPVYKDKAREVLGLMFDLVKPRVVYHHEDAVFAISFS